MKRGLGISRKEPDKLRESDKRLLSQHLHGLSFLSLIVFHNYLVLYVLSRAVRLWEQLQLHVIVAS